MSTRAYTISYHYYRIDDLEPTLRRSTAQGPISVRRRHSREFEPLRNTVHVLLKTLRRYLVKHQDEVKDLPSADDSKLKNRELVTIQGLDFQAVSPPGPEVYQF